MDDDANPDRLGEKLYPLAEHFLAILDTQNPIETLHAEVERFESWLTAICEELEEIYTEGKYYPVDRPPETWTEQDENFVRLDYRWRLLNRTHRALLEEKELLKTLPVKYSVRGLLEILVSIFEQLDELPCPYYEKKPENVLAIKMFPPLQKLTFETIKLLGRSAEQSVDEKLKALCLFQYTYLRNLGVGWMCELLPVKTAAYFSHEERILDDWWVVFSHKAPN